MPTLELSPEELAMLRELLESSLSDLRLEVAATERKEMRDDLKRKEAVLRALIERLSAAG